MIRLPSCVLALLLGPTSIGMADSPREKPAPLFSNGNFEKVDDKGWPNDWPHPDGVTFEKEDTTRFLRLRSSRPGQMVLVYRRADLPSPPPPGLEFRLRARYTDVKAGKENWYDGRVMGHFKSKDGRTLKPEPIVPTFHGSSAGWVERIYFVKVPVGATYLEIMPCLFQPASGTLDLAQFLVLPATEEQLAAARPKIIPSETVVPAKQDSWPRDLHVVGNQLLTADALRDLAAALAFGPGLFHFFPRSEWLRLGAYVGLEVERERRITPFVRAFVFRRQFTPQNTMT
jgi:hypothetical protein